MLRRMYETAYFILVLAVSAAAQTNTFPTTGNAGIGTTAPNAPLEVKGALVVDGNGNSLTATQLNMGNWGYTGLVIGIPALVLMLGWRSVAVYAIQLERATAL